MPIKNSCRLFLLLILTLADCVDGQQQPLDQTVKLVKELVLHNGSYSVVESCKNVSVSEQDVADVYFTHYGAWQRPRLDPSKQVDVNLSFVLSAIEDVIEKDKVIRLNGYLDISWFDDFHRWDDGFPYNCISYVVLPSANVWLPDIAQINNNEGRYRLMLMPGEKVRIHSNGLAAFSPGGTFEASCDFDLSLFPFDSQKCSIQLESWLYTRSHVRFVLGSDAVKISNRWSVSEQWSLVDTEQILTTLNATLDPKDHFDHIEFRVLIRRKSMHYVVQIFIPAIIITLAELANFAISTGDFIKLHISFTCLVAYTFFQALIVNELPRTSDHIPLLIIYINLQMAFIALSMLGEGLVFIMWKWGTHQRNRDHSPSRVPPVPKWLYFSACLLGRCLWAYHAPTKLKSSSSEAEFRDYVRVYISVFSGDQKPLLMCSRVKRLACYASSVQGSENELLTELLESMRFDEDNAEVVIANDNHRKRHASRQQKWRYIAEVVERLNFVVYLTLAIATPTAMLA